MQAYTQLTEEQGVQVHALKNAGRRQTEMPRVVGVHTSTISRELKRESGKRAYRPNQAQWVALK